MTKSILKINNLRTSFFTDEGEIKAVDGIDFEIEKGKALGIVGESGSGKSITSLSIMRLLQEPAGRIVDGEILFKGEDLVKKSPNEMRKIRGNSISMVFQEPMTSLNPTITVGEQIAESIRIHQGLDKKQAFNKAVQMF